MAEAKAAVDSIEKTANDAIKDSPPAPEVSVEVPGPVKVKNISRSLVNGIEPGAEGEISFADWTNLFEYFEKI